MDAVRAGCPAAAGFHAGTLVARESTGGCHGVPLLPACAKLLSCLAYWGADDLPAAQRAFGYGVEKLQRGTLPMEALQNCGLPALDASLGQLVLASPNMKRTVLSACTACIAADGGVTVEEAELLRAIADSLDCPIPPFLAGQPLAAA